jgi:hypothetical protein
MRLQLVIDVPSSADRDEVIQKLAAAQATGRGITITTASGYAVDVDLVIFENQGSGLQGVHS